MSPAGAIPLGIAVLIAAALGAFRAEPAQRRDLPIPGLLLDRAKRALAAAGAPTRYTPERFSLLACACGAAGGALGLALTWGNPILVLVGPGLALAGLVSPFRLLALQAARRREQVLRELPDLLDLLAICVGSGMALDPALRLAVSRFPGLVSQEFRQLFAEIDLGARRSEAYRDLGRRLGASEARSFATALIQADALGLPLTETLADQAESLRASRERMVRIRAEKAAPRVQLVVALVMVPGAMILILGALVLELIERLSMLGAVG